MMRCKGVQLAPPGGSNVGGPQEQDQHELRQAVPGPSLLLRQRYDEEGGWPDFYLQVSAGTFMGRSVLI